ncbi:MAG TPA: response regulator transcription factor [Chthonomonadaceae bacterium]|nr:response regulator transcription factor [Chthonomonadaceae bacterium]
MTSNKSIRILIADDHPVVRAGLAAMISSQPDMEVIGQACNGQEAIDFFRSHSPDVALIDWRMPQISGWQATATICREFPNAHIIVLTTYDDHEDIYRAIQAGAHAYLLKDIPGEELFRTIRQVHSGQICLPAEMAAKLAQRLRCQELTARELEVLQLMAAGQSNQEIGQTLYITEATVKGHVSSILTKLDASDRTQAVTEGLRRGIIRL